MKKQFLTISMTAAFLFALTVFTGCDDEQTLILKDKNVGKLKVNLYEDSNDNEEAGPTSITNELIRLFQAGSLIKSELTDEEGSIDFKKVNAGSYMIASNDISIDGDYSPGDLKYTVNQSLQILTDETTELDLYVKDFVGTYKIFAQRELWVDGAIGQGGYWDYRNYRADAYIFYENEYSKISHQFNQNFEGSRDYDYAIEEVQFSDGSAEVTLPSAYNYIILFTYFNDEDERQWRIRSLSFLSKDEIREVNYRL